MPVGTTRRCGDLLDRSPAHDVHIDVAVIPVELDDAPGHRRCATAPRAGLVHLHQHGFRHVNHETTGRKCEFGPSRSHDQQLADIAEGRALMANTCTRTSSRSSPRRGIDAPPKQQRRCSISASGPVTRPHGRTVRRRASAEMPVTIDWFAKTQGRAVGARADRRADRRADLSAHRARRSHAAPRRHRPRQLELIDQLLTFVAEHPSASSTSIYSSSF